MLTRLIRFRALASCGVALAAAATLVAPANAGPLAGTYSVSKSTATYVQGTQSVLKPGGNFLVTLSTTATGARKLPFRLKVWDETYTKVSVSTKGNVQFGANPQTSFSNGCLPAQADLAVPFVAVYWDDVLLQTGKTPEHGIYVRTFGTAPNRKFVISWRGASVSNAARRFSIVFNEGSPNFDTHYNAGDAKSATIGAQITSTNHDQYSCNATTPIGANTRLRWTRVLN